MWNMWWRDSNWGRYFNEHCGFPFVVSLHKYSNLYSWFQASAAQYMKYSLFWDLRGVDQ